MTIDPTNNLRPGTYTVTIKTGSTAGAADLAGNRLDQDPTKAGLQPRTWTFTV